MSLFLMSLSIKAESRNSIEFLLPGTTRKAKHMQDKWPPSCKTPHTQQDKTESERNEYTIASERNDENCEINSKMHNHTHPKKKKKVKQPQTVIKKKKKKKI